MKKITCHDCASPDIPQNESLKVDDLDYCIPCAEKNFPDDASVAGKKVEKHHDPTVCVECATDFGDTILPKLAHYPICEPCQATIRQKAFPTWVKAFLAGIAAIVIFSIFWNWKYYEAYADVQTANDYAAKGDYTKGALFMQSASSIVPEVEDLKTLTNFYQGVGYLQTDQGEKALITLQKCQGKLPDDYHLAALILNAQVGTTFDKKDYDGFLKANRAQFEMDSTLVDNWYGVASAYSCLYVTKGDEIHKTQAEHYLAGAHKIDSISVESKFYSNMIEYRLANHKMITRQEFKKQFPHGWTKP